MRACGEGFEDGRGESKCVELGGDGATKKSLLLGLSVVFMAQHKHAACFTATGLRLYGYNYDQH